MNIPEYICRDILHRCNSNNLQYNILLTIGQYQPSAGFVPAIYRRQYQISLSAGGYGLPLLSDKHFHALPCRACGKQTNTTQSIPLNQYHGRLHISSIFLLQAALFLRGTLAFSGLSYNLYHTPYSGIFVFPSGFFPYLFGFLFDDTKGIALFRLWLFFSCLDYIIRRVLWTLLFS